MLKHFFVALIVLFAGVVVRADNMGAGKQAVRSLFPEIITEQQLSGAARPERYKFLIALSGKRAVKRVRKAYATRKKLHAGIFVSRMTRLRNGDQGFELSDKAGNRIGSCRLTPYGNKTEVIFTPAFKTARDLDYRVFKVRPKLRLFPLRH